MSAALSDPARCASPGDGPCARQSLRSIQGAGSSGKMRRARVEMSSFGAGGATGTGVPSTSANRVGTSRCRWSPVINAVASCGSQSEARKLEVATGSMLGGVCAIRLAANGRGRSAFEATAEKQRRCQGYRQQRTGHQRGRRRREPVVRNLVEDALQHDAHLRSAQCSVICLIEAPQPVVARTKGIIVAQATAQPATQPTRQTSVGVEQQQQVRELGEGLVSCPRLRAKLPDSSAHFCHDFRSNTCASNRLRRGGKHCQPRNITAHYIRAHHTSWRTSRVAGKLIRTVQPLNVPALSSTTRPACSCTMR